MIRAVSPSVRVKEPSTELRAFSASLFEDKLGFILNCKNPDARDLAHVMKRTCSFHRNGNHTATS